MRLIQQTVQIIQIILFRVWRHFVFGLVSHSYMRPNRQAECDLNNSVVGYTIGLFARGDWFLESKN